MSLKSLDRTPVTQVDQENTQMTAASSISANEGNSIGEESSISVNGGDSSGEGLSGSNVKVRIQQTKALCA